MSLPKALQWTTPQAQAICGDKRGIVTNNVYEPETCKWWNIQDSTVPFNSEEQGTVPTLVLLSKLYESVFPPHSPVSLSSATSSHP